MAYEAPLPPPPRKAHFRRGIRNARRAYRSVFAIVIVVFAGWALLDAVRWQELTPDARVLTIGFGSAALLAWIVLWLVDRPLARELRLARRGVATPGQILAIGKPRGKRRIVRITYSFPSPAGGVSEGGCRLPRRVPSTDLAVGMAIEVLYDPKNPTLHKPRLALESVEFGDLPKKPMGPA